MTGTARLALIPALLALAFGATVSGHHSQTQFNSKETITLEGTLTEIRWTNPHSFFYIDGRQPGEGAVMQSWAIEAPGPRGLENAGWMRDTAKVGDKVTVSGNPRRDGKPQLLILSITLPDGRKLSIPSGVAGMSTLAIFDSHAYPGCLAKISSPAAEGTWDAEVVFEDGAHSGALCTAIDASTFTAGIAPYTTAAGTRIRQKTWLVAIENRRTGACRIAAQAGKAGKRR